MVFKPSANQSAEVPILQAGQVVSSRGSINSLGHLVLEDVQESDEGMYIVRNTSNPRAVQHLILLVRGKNRYTAQHCCYTCIASIPHLINTHRHFCHYLLTNVIVHWKTPPLVVHQTVLWRMASSMEKRTASLSTTFKAPSPSCSGAVKSKIDQPKLKQNYVFVKYVLLLIGLLFHLFPGLVWIRGITLWCTATPRLLL